MKNLVNEKELMEVQGGQAVAELCSQVSWLFGFGLGMVEWHITTGNAAMQIAIYQAHKK